MRARWRAVASVMIWGGDDDDLFDAIWSLSGINVEHVLCCGGVTFQSEQDMIVFALRWHDHENAHYDKVQLRAFLMPPHPRLPLDLDDLREIVGDLLPGRAVAVPVVYARVWLADEKAKQALELGVERIASHHGFEHEITLTRTAPAPAT